MCLKGWIFIMIDIHDNILDEVDAANLHSAVQEISWKYFAGSSGPLSGNAEEAEPVEPIWHISPGHEWMNFWKKLYLKLGHKYGDLELYRLYLNAHTRGMFPHYHTDDGDLHLLYNPNMSWKSSFEGGTIIYKEATKIPDQLVEYKGNRLVIFDSYLPHQAQHVTEKCLDLRTVIVVKCYIEGSNRERLDFYNV